MAFCIKCGKELPEGMKFCIECGTEQAKPQPTPVTVAQPQERPVSEATATSNPQPSERTTFDTQTTFTSPYTSQENASAPPVYQAPVQGYYPPYQEEMRPSEGGRYSVVGTGTYFWFTVLFSLPLIGFIFCIVFACGVGNNENIRNFARAKLILAAISFLLIIILVFAIFIFSVEFLNTATPEYWEQYFYEFSQNAPGSYAMPSF